jgi:hypothetical protein
MATRGVTLKIAGMGFASLAPIILGLVFALVGIVLGALYGLATGAMVGLLIGTALIVIGFLLKDEY